MTAPTFSLQGNKKHIKNKSVATPLSSFWLQLLLKVRHIKKWEGWYTDSILKFKLCISGGIFLLLMKQFCSLLHTFLVSTHVLAVGASLDLGKTLTVFQIVCFYELTQVQFTMYIMFLHHAV